MENKLVTIDGILDWFQDAVERKMPVSSAIYLDGCQKLVALLGNFDDSLIEAELAYRRLRSGFIEDGKSAAESEARAKASDAYRDYLKLKAKRDRITEFILLGKARLKLPVWDT